MTIHVKKLPGQSAYGNSARITYTGTEAVPAANSIIDQTGGSPDDIIIDRIYIVSNFSGVDVTGPGGFVFAPGKWDFSLEGGLVIPPIFAGGALPGDTNCSITVAGKVIWTDPSHTKSY